MFLTQRPRPVHHFRPLQRGVATILIVLLVGIAMTGAALGVAYSVKGAQERAATTQASTASQMAAWAGVEVLTRYLQQLGSRAAIQTALAGDPSPAINMTLPDTAIDGTRITLSARPQTPLLASSALPALLSMLVTAQDTQTGTSTVLNVVYDLGLAAPNPAGPGKESPGCSPGFELHEDTVFMGGEQSLSQANSPLSILVRGRFTVPLGANIVSGFESIVATDEVEILAEVDVNRIHSNASVRLAGNAVATEILAVKNVTLDFESGYGFAQKIWANGDIFLEGGNTDEVYAIKGDVTVTSAAAAPDRFQNAPLVANPSGAGRVALVGDEVHDKILAKGKVDVTSGEVSLLQAEGLVSGSGLGRVAEVVTASDFSCPTAWGAGRVSTLSAANQPAPNLTGCGGLIGVRGEEPLPPEVTPVEVPPPVFDARAPAVMAEANYRVSWNPGLGRIQVAVKNVKNISPANGAEEVYFLGDFAPAWVTDPSKKTVMSNGNTLTRAGFKDYLCKAFDGAGNCVCSQGQPTACTDTQPRATLCWAGTTWGANGCFAYDAATNTFELSGHSLLPGVYWFDGNVKLEMNHTVSTLIATGNITSGVLQNAAVEAVNFAGINAICEANLGNLETANVTNDNSTGQKRFVRLLETLKDNSDLRAALGFDPNDPDFLTPDYRYVHRDFVGYYPTDSCVEAAGRWTFKPKTYANFALAAGSRAGTAYVGGDIHFETNNNIYGSVLAGNTLKAKYDFKIQGLLSAYGQQASAGENRFERSVNATLVDRPYFTPNPFNKKDCQNAAATSSTSSTESTPLAPFNVKMRWAKYL